MHVEKNMVDNIIGMLLEMKRKMKDNHEARKDLHKMGLRPQIHPFNNDKGKAYMPTACHPMSNVAF
jgi:hypothetical protein